jgi:uncharacterized RDD family membrane protein YckC
MPGAGHCHACGSPLPVLCGSCGEANERSSNYCFRCGSLLEAGESPPDSPQTEPASAATVCPSCRQPNQPGSVHCYSCGLPLEAARGRPGGFFTERPDAPAFSIGRPAGFWIRLAAYAIDVGLLLIIFVSAGPLVFGQTFSEFIESFVKSEEAVTGADWFSLALNIVYFTAGVAVWATTVGKRAFRLYVVRSDGSRVGPGRALARYFASQLSMLILGVGFVMAGVRSDKRGLHDLICDTVVIIRDR